MFWENSIKTSVLSRVKQITSPGWMHETSAQGWCTGKTQRDGMVREVGGVNTCKSMADSCHVNVWQKPLQYCKVISLQLIKINEKKREKGMTEDEMVRWRHQLNGHEFEQASGVGDGQRSLVWCSPWGSKESDMTGQLNWTELIWKLSRSFNESNNRQ